MPLGRYFAYVGSMLLALLFLADWYFPKPDAVPDRGGIDKSVIQIGSAQRWPERVVIDTRAVHRLFESGGFQFFGEYDSRCWLGWRPASDGPTSFQ
jgi:hypothetical protein